jgi:hypothetical protein
MADGAPEDKRDAAQMFVQSLAAGIKPVRARAAPRSLEGPVVAAISELLSRLPNIALAVRQNSGMASYEAKTGKYQPVFFYKLLRHGKEVTITDFWGVLKDGRMFAIEAKAPGFREPRTEREFKQANFLALIRNCGGIGIFATDAQQVAAALA